jgi:predicted permease
MQNVLAVDPGYDLRDGVVLPVNLAFSRYEEEESQRLFRELLERAESLPGARAATWAAFLPLGQGHGRHYVAIAGYQPDRDEFMTPRRNMVGPGYFEIMGIPVMQGRGIDGRDREDSEPVVVINETMARRYWPGRDPIGGTVAADLGIPRTVVGVMKDGKYGALNESPEPYLVIPLSQAPHMGALHLIVETEGDPRGMMQPLLREVRALDPNLPGLEAMTVREHLDLASAGARLPTVLVSSFGLLALALALVGVFGVMSYAVSQRVREFGIRVAMGADTAGIVRIVLVRGLRTTMLGVGAGVVLAVVATRVLAGMLYGVSTLDPLVFLTVSVALIVVAMVACYLPARRAAGVDPVTALRAE